MMNAIEATLINNQSAFDALLKNFAQIKTKLNMKINKIKKLYKFKKKSIENNIMNNDDKVFQYDKTCDSLQMRERNQNNE